MIVYLFINLALFFKGNLYIYIYIVFFGGGEG